MENPIYSRRLENPNTMKFKTPSFKKKMVQPAPELKASKPETEQESKQQSKFTQAILQNAKKHYGLNQEKLQTANSTTPEGKTMKDCDC